jgi:Uma2 family endonuclease
VIETALMTEAIRQRFDFSDYVSLEEDSTVKHEFLGGLVWPMAGGSPDHARIAANITAWLSTQLAGRRCTVFGSDLRVRVLATGLATYPDVTVVCGPLEFDPEDSKRHTVINPALIVEILSPATEEYDSGEKLLHYQQIASLQEIALVAQAEQRIEIWRRGPHGWAREAEASDPARLLTLGCDLPLTAVYRDPLAG